MSLRLCLSRISRSDKGFNPKTRVWNPKEIIRYVPTMSLNSKRGALLVFEGLDRSGKSTQSRLLVESLKKAGEQAELMVFPDRTTPVGKIIGEYLSNKTYDLNDKALHLLFTANRFEKMTKMKKLLFSGVNVIVDRYCFSGIVFSSAKNGMDPDWCKYPESGLPAPDVVFYLNLPFDEMKKRPGFGAERYESIAFQTKVQDEYEHLANEFNFTKVDGQGTIDSIQNAILKHSLKIIDKVKATDLHYLDFIEKEMESYKKENIDVNTMFK